jgi:hypothetical protein
MNNARCTAATATLTNLHAEGQRGMTDQHPAHAIFRSDDCAGKEWLDATFCMTANANESSPDGRNSWVFRRPCPGTPVHRVSFRRVGGELWATILLRPPVSDAFRVALRFNPITFLSQHNRMLRELLEPFTLVTSVDFRIRPRSRLGPLPFGNRPADVPS